MSCEDLTLDLTLEYNSTEYFETIVAIRNMSNSSILPKNWENIKVYGKSQENQRH